MQAVIYCGVTQPCSYGLHSWLRADTAAYLGCILYLTNCETEFVAINDIFSSSPRQVLFEEI